MAANMLGFDLAMSGIKAAFREEATIQRERARTKLSPSDSDDMSVQLKELVQGVAAAEIAESLERIASKL